MAYGRGVADQCNYLVKQRSIVLNQINLEAYLEDNEVLTIKIPEYLNPKKLKVILDFDTLLPSKDGEFADEKLEWKKFIEETAGSIDDETFVRQPQGEYEIREPLE